MAVFMLTRRDRLAVPMPGHQMSMQLLDVLLGLAAAGLDFEVIEVVIHINLQSNVTPQ